MNRQPILEARKLVKAYSGRTVVNRVSYHVDDGEIVGLLGPNGAGKTTTFRMTVGMITPASGQILLAGEDVTRLPMFRRARLGLGYLAQEPSVFRQMTVEGNLLSILEMRKVKKMERTERAEELLDEMGLTHLAKHRAQTLSGGERRRLEIARTLATNPRLILLDEPFSGIDPIVVDELRKILKALKARGISILITDHAARATFLTTDRVYIIADGKILRHGTPRELADDSDVRRVYLGEDFSLGTS